MSEEQIAQSCSQADEPVGAFGEIGSWDDITAESGRSFAPSARRTSRRTCRSSRTPAFPENQLSNSSTSWKASASSRSAS